MQEMGAMEVYLRFNRLLYGNNLTLKDTAGRQWCQRELQRQRYSFLTSQISNAMQAEHQGTIWSWCQFKVPSGKKASVMYSKYVIKTIYMREV
jgi:hypothetical protein